MSEVVFLFVAVGILDSPKLLFVLIKIFFLALLARLAGLGLDLIGEGIGIRALVGNKIRRMRLLRRAMTCK